MRKIFSLFFGFLCVLGCKTAHSGQFSEVKQICPDPSQNFNRLETISAFADTGKFTTNNEASALAITTINGSIAIHVASAQGDLDRWHNSQIQSLSDGMGFTRISGLTADSNGMLYASVREGGCPGSWEDPSWKLSTIMRLNSGNWEYVVGDDSQGGKHSGFFNCFQGHSLNDLIVDGNLLYASVGDIPSDQPEWKRLMLPPAANTRFGEVIQVDLTCGGLPLNTGDNSCIRTVARGLRNPFGMTLYKPANALYIGDNGGNPQSGGQDQVEEVNRVLTTQSLDFGHPGCKYFENIGPAGCNAGHAAPLHQIEPHVSPTGMATDSQCGYSILGSWSKKLFVLTGHAAGPERIREVVAALPGGAMESRISDVEFYNGSFYVLTLGGTIYRYSF